MLLNNYFNIRKYMFIGHATNTVVNPFSHLPIVNVDGSILPAFYPSGGNRTDLGYWLNKLRCRAIPTGTQAADDTLFGIFLGSGSTPATKTDYTLESPIVSGLSFTSPNMFFTYTEDTAGNLVCSCSHIVTNTTDAEINICEMGVVVPAPYYTYNYTTNYYPVLIERTVLSEPIIIPPGEPKLVTISVDLNMSLNVE